MPYLTPKTRAGSSWLPSQVEYGIDCSADDPADWKPFGALVERQADKAKQDAQKLASKGGQPAQ